MDKIELIKQAIEKADKMQSRLDGQSIMVPALASLRIRHLLNNLGAISTVAVDHGSHVGGSFCSIVANNPNLEVAVSIDSWASDETEGHKYEQDFRGNAERFIPKKTKLQVIKSDSFSVDLSVLPKNIDLYYFDGSHDADSQCRAITYYLPAMANEFIYCVDDFMLEDVKEGTERGIKESGVEVLFEQEFVTDHEYDNMSWWRGWKVFLLRKPSAKLKAKKKPK